VAASACTSSLIPARPVELPNQLHVAVLDQKPLPHVVAQDAAGPFAVLIELVEGAGEGREGLQVVGRDAPFGEERQHQRPLPLEILPGRLRGRSAAGQPEAQQPEIGDQVHRGRTGDLQGLGGLAVAAPGGGEHRQAQHEADAEDHRRQDGVVAHGGLLVPGRRA